MARQRLQDIRDEYLHVGDPEGAQRNIERPKIDKRNGGCAAMVNGELYVWGGETEDIVYDEEEPDEPPLRVARDLPRYFDDDHPFDVFQLDTRTWIRKRTTGEFPTNGLGSILEYDQERNQLCLFGGWKRRQFDSELYVVSLDDFCWKILQIDGTECKPSPRYNPAGLLHRGRLCVFGGVGPDTVRNGRKQDPGADDWLPAPGAANDSYGWNNEYFQFDFSKGTECWSAPLREGIIRPPPLAGHRMARIDSERAAMFGGSGKEGGSNQLWVIDLDDNVWSRLITSDQSWPRSCRFFSFNPLHDPDMVGRSLYKGCSPLKQQILLLWGKARYEGIDEEICHRETWILELDEDRPSWTKISINGKPRAWHVAGTYHPFNNPTQCEVIVTGGNKHYRGQTGARVAVSDTCTLQFGVMSLQSICLNVILKELIIFKDIPAAAALLDDSDSFGLPLSPNVKAQILDYAKLLYCSVPQLLCYH